MSNTPGRTKRIIVSLVLAVLLLGMGIVSASILIALAKEPPRREIEFLPPLVETMVVTPQDVQEWIPAYGSVRAIRRTNVAAEVSATVVERPETIRAGADVTEGQILLRLDDREYRRLYERAVARAEAQEASVAALDAETEKLQELLTTARHELKVAEDEKTRVTRLFEQQMAAKRELDLARLAYRQALRTLQSYEREYVQLQHRREGLLAQVRASQAEAELAKLNVERCTIRAPFAGRLETVNVETGDHVAAGTVVATVVDARRVEIPLNLPTATFGRVRVGNKCRIVCESAADFTWTGRVERIAPAADTETRTYAVYVIVDNTRQATPLHPGMFVKASVRGEVYAQSLVVPRSACRNGRVLVAVDGVVKARGVTIRRRLGDRALVTGELRPGDRVIVTYLDRLAEGSPVRVKETWTRATEPPTGEATPEGSP